MWCNVFDSPCCAVFPAMFFFSEKIFLLFYKWSSLWFWDKHEKTQSQHDKLCPKATTVFMYQLWLKFGIFIFVSLSEFSLMLKALRTAHGLKRKKRDWILPPTKLSENVDYRMKPFVAKVSTRHSITFTRFEAHFKEWKLLGHKPERHVFSGSWEVKMSIWAESQPGRNRELAWQVFKAK